MVILWTMNWDKEVLQENIIVKTLLWLYSWKFKYLAAVRHIILDIDIRYSNKIFYNDRLLKLHKTESLQGIK